jgi:hypothetical protein
MKREKSASDSSTYRASSEAREENVEGYKTRNRRRPPGLRPNVSAFFDCFTVSNYWYNSRVFRMDFKVFLFP